MKFYRVHYSTEHGNSGGYSWHTSRRDADKAAREAIGNDPQEYASVGHPPIEEVEIQPSRAGILSALRRYASHEENG